MTIDVALADSGFDLFAGGGLKDPADKKKKSANFKGNALELIKKAGYKVVTNKADFMKLTPADGKILAWNNWLQDSKALPYVMDTGPGDLTLVDITAKAIALLDNPKGFFLMVEGGKIDWACHANDATASVTNTLSFDKAIAEAIDFANRHPGETLIVVTGDHECGGLTLGFAGTQYESNFTILGRQQVSFQKFTDEVMATFKEKCRGKCTFDDIKPLITANFGLTFNGDIKADPMVLEPYQIETLRQAFGRSMGGESETAKDASTAMLYGGYDPLTISLTHVLNNKAGLGWTSYSHTGVPVTTSAMGLGADRFNGYYDNTDVGLKIMAIMGFAPQVQFAGDPAPVRMAAN